MPSFLSLSTLARAWRLLHVLSLLAVFMLISFSCETVLSDNPPPHRILHELEQWPDDYYWLLEAGVSSRVLGTRMPGESLQEARQRLTGLLGQVKQQWAAIGALHTAPAVLDYLRKHDLEPLASAVEATLTQTQSHAPAAGINMQLQAMAIKRGLIFAHREITGER